MGGGGGGGCSRSKSQVNVDGKLHVVTCSPGQSLHHPWAGLNVDFTYGHGILFSDRLRNAFTKNNDGSEGKMLRLEFA